MGMYSVFNLQSLLSNLKLLRRVYRRTRATLRRGSLTNAPILFANSFPKSGTHLLTQVLQGLTQIGPAVEAGLPAMVMYAGVTGQARSPEEILTDLGRLRGGDIAYGHLHVTPAIQEKLTGPNMAPFFIYRDPRDVVVSHVHYVTEMEPNHVHHVYYSQTLKDFDERLRTSILGRPELDVPFPDIRGRFEPYLGWLDCPEVLPLRFEDFITHRSATLERVLDHAQRRGFTVNTTREQALRVLDSAINPEKSPTFRSGKVGKWRAAFKESHKKIFKDVAGDLLILLGYDETNDW
jgi:sulfotransferase 6B1